MSSPVSSGLRPVVSVVVPVYRVPEFYLRPCAESLKAQPIANAEFLFVVDGPDSKTETLLRGIFADDPRFCLTVLPVNGGVSRARNTALAQVRGRFFCFLDADDRFPPGILETVASEMERNPQTDIFVGLCRGEQSDPFSARRCFFFPPPVKPGPLSDETLARFTVWAEAWGAGKFFNAKLLPHGFSEDLHYYEDTLFVWQLLGKASAIAFLPHFVYTIVSRPDSAHRGTLSTESRRNSLQGLGKLAQMPVPGQGGKHLLHVRLFRLFLELFGSVLLQGLSDNQAAELLPAVRKVSDILLSPPYPRLPLPLRWLVRQRLASPKALAHPTRIQHMIVYDAYRVATAPWRCEPRFLTTLAVFAPPLYRHFAPRFKPLPLFPRPCS